MNHAMLFCQMNKWMLSLMLISFLSVIDLNGYTFRVCYNGSDDPEVIAPDAVTINSAIHGGSACWAPNFSVRLNKGESKDITIIPTSNPLWNCHLVPETVNGQTIRPAVGGGWPLLNLHGPTAESLGETWQIKKSIPQVIQMPSLRVPRIIRNPIIFTINWFAEIEDGLKNCNPFETLTKKQPSVTKQYKNMSVDEQATLRKDWFDAAFNHRLDEMKEIIGMGIDVNVKDDDGDSALLLALEPIRGINPCFSDKTISIIDLLLSKGADAAVISEIPILKIKKWALNIVANWASSCLNDAGVFVNCNCPAGVVTKAMNLLLTHGAAGANNQLARDAMTTAQRTSSTTNKENTEAEDALRAYLEKNK